MPSTRIKDNQGTPDNVFQFGHWDLKETVKLEENSTVVTLAVASGNFILDHDGKGVIGTHKLGVNPASETIVRVINPNNTFRDHIRSKRFYEGASTCTIDTTNYEIRF